MNRSADPTRTRHDADSSAILKIAADRLNAGEIQYFALLNGKFAGVKYYLDRIAGAKIYPATDPR